MRNKTLRFLYEEKRYMMAPRKRAKNGAATTEWVIPRWYLRENSGPKIEAMISISGKTAPTTKEIVAILPIS
jgi:hypothetical protein